jgi:Holliday junction resolvase RusA-like endonuclease
METATLDHSPFDVATAAIPSESILCRLILGGDPHTKSPDNKGGNYASRHVQRTRILLKNLLDISSPAFTIDRSHDLGVALAFYTQTRQRRDLDNLEKLILDACTNLLWGDDLQIVELISRVYRGHHTPRTELTVYTIGQGYQRQCEECNSIIPNFHKMLVKSRNTRFCSKTCYDVAQQKGRYVYCTTCTKRIYRQNDKLIQKRWFCSSECRSVAITAHRICRHCQQPFQKAGQRNSFCSEVCRYAWHTVKRAASQRPAQCPICNAPSGKRHGLAQLCQKCFLHKLNGREAVRGAATVIGYTDTGDVSGKQPDLFLTCRADVILRQER